MKVEKLVREFKYGSLALADPDPAQSPEEVKTFYAGMYPELNNAEIEGPDHKNGKSLYTFRKAVGTKGADSPAPLSQEELYAALIKLGWRIEACGASVELTHAVTLCSDIRQSIGNQFNPADSYAAQRVRQTLQCAHVWIANSGLGGEPEFRRNASMRAEPHMHVLCSKCGDRTWFTEAQWNEMPL
jgi:PRTRC genetic system protein C